MVSKKKERPADTPAPMTKHVRKSRGGGTTAPKHGQPVNGRWVMVLDERFHRRMVFEPKS